MFLQFTNGRCVVGIKQMHTQVMGACSYQKNLVDYLIKSEIAQNQVTEMVRNLGLKESLHEFKADKLVEFNFN